MKPVEAKSTAYMLQKIANIEKEVMNLKLSVLKNLSPGGRKVPSLKGILKGVDITEGDVSSARKSLYDKIRI